MSLLPSKKAPATESFYKSSYDHVGISAKHFSGTMLMYGIKCQPHNMKYAQEHRLCCTSCPCFYNIGTPRNAALEKLWQQHPNKSADPEASHVPAVAKRRAEIADEVDPTKSHRISRHCNAFACSMSANFAIAPHDDSGFCESVMLINRHGGPPARKTK